jgi:hypothetical protein
LVIPDTTKRSSPTGGVIQPIDRFTIISTPKNIGSIPNDRATGKRIGTNITTAAEAFIRVPTNNNNTFTSIKKTIGLLLIDVIKVATLCGTWALVKIQPKRFAPATMNIITVVLIVALNIAEGISL